MEDKYIKLHQELSNIYEELDEIYNRLTALVAIDNDPSFIAIIASLGDVKWKILRHRNLEH